MVDQVKMVEREGAGDSDVRATDCQRPGPPSEQDMGLAEVGWRPASLDTFRCGADSTAPSLVWGDATGSRALQGSSGPGPGVKEAHLEKGKSTKLLCRPRTEHPRSPRGGIRVG